MQDRERRVGRRGGRLALLQRAGQAEHAGGQPRRALQQVVALGGRRLVEHGLEELAHDAEGEVALELGAAGAQEARRAVLARRRRAAASTADLPMPAGPSTTTPRPDPARAAAIAASMHRSSRSRSRRRSTP